MNDSERENISALLLMSRGLKKLRRQALVNSRKLYQPRLSVLNFLQRFWKIDAGASEARDSVWGLDMRLPR